MHEAWPVGAGATRALKPWRPVDLRAYSGMGMLRYASAFLSLCMCACACVRVRVRVCVCVCVPILSLRPATQVKRQKEVRNSCSTWFRYDLPQHTGQMDAAPSASSEREHLMLMKATRPCKQAARAKNSKASQVLQPAQAPAQKLSVANAAWHG